MKFDLSHLPQNILRKIDEIFRTDYDLKVLKAIERQTRTAKARENGLRWRDDFVPKFEIDPVVDTHWSHFYGHNYQENPDLMRFLAARNPEIKIKARSGKIQVGYTGNVPPTSCRRNQSRPAGKMPAARFDRGTLELAK